MGIQSISENKMAIQLIFEEFFGTPAREMVRKTDPDTSVAAALSVDSTQLEAMVYEIIAKYPNGCTSDEVMHHFPSHGVQTISPRFAPLIRKGFIYDTGERRRASSGRSQRVMKVVQK